MNKKRIITIIIALRMLITVCYAINTDDAPYLISGWEGPYEEGVTWFATKDLSIHGGFDPELELILDGVTPFPIVHFQIVNSANKPVTVEPFNIYVCIYHTDDEEGQPVFSFEIPVLKGTMPAHTFYLYTAAKWYGTDRNGEMLPNGEYVLRTHLPDQFIFSVEGDDTIIAHEVDYRYPGNKIFSINTEWPKTFTAYVGAGLYVNGKPFVPDKTEGEALCIDNRIYLPLRAISKALSAEVSWDDSNHIAYVNKDISITAESAAIPQLLDSNILTATTVKAYGNLEIRVNHNYLLSEYIEDIDDIDGCQLIINNRVYVPLRALSHVLSIPIHWDNQKKSVFIGGY